MNLHRHGNVKCAAGVYGGGNQHVAYAPCKAPPVSKSGTWIFLRQNRV
jgi:hypothetical protein